MSDVWDSGTPEPDNSPAGLRAALEKANARAKAAEKAAADREAENTRLNGIVRQTSVEKLLSTKGIDAALFAKHVPADVEPTEENIGKWIDDNKGVYNFKMKSDPQTPAPAPAAQQAAQSGQTTDETVSTNPLEGVDMNLVDQLVRMGVLADRSQAISGTEQAQLAEQVAQANPASLDDAKQILAGMGLEVQDTSGFNPAFYKP